MGGLVRPNKTGRAFATVAVRGLGLRGELGGLLNEVACTDDMDAIIDCGLRLRAISPFFVGSTATCSKLGRWLLLITKLVELTGLAERGEGA